jgi:hypothetical protein
MKPLSRKTANLSESVHQQLGMYALAASAAGVGMLALAQPAEAKIVYTKAHHVIGKNAVFQLDLNHDGTIDFTLQNRNCPYGGSNGATSCTSSSWNLLTAAGASGNSVEGTNQKFGFWAVDLKAGMRVSNKQTFARKGMMAHQCFGVACSVTSRTHTSGNWPNVRNRYLGLKFQIDKKAHYGWARLSVETSKKPLRTTATLTGYAYETIPDKPIIAGKTQGPDDTSIEESNGTPGMPTPEPARLGVLAMGAPGLSIWRREESLGAMQ